MKKIYFSVFVITFGFVFTSCLTQQKMEPGLNKNSSRNSSRNPTNSNSDKNCESMKYQGISKAENLQSAYSRPGFNTLTQKCEVEIPIGLSKGDWADFEHLSEGADVYPYEWFMNLKSAVFPDDQIYGENLKGNYKQFFHQFLDKKFGILKTNEEFSFKKVNGTPRRVKYLIPYAGLTASWNNFPVDDSYIQSTNDVSNSADAFAEYDNENIKSELTPENRIIKEINGIKSIRMVGTNCALCHSGSISYDGKLLPVQGAPSMVNVRGFFKDMAGSTVLMLTKKEVLEEFLTNIKKSDPQVFKHLNPKVDANKISDEFVKDFAKATNIFAHLSKKEGESSVLGKASNLTANAYNLIIDYGIILKKVSAGITLLKAKGGDNSRLFEGIAAINRGLVKLLKTTYNLTDEDLQASHLGRRMEYFAKLSVGIDPSTTETPSGFNRTDAFGRIGNLVLRGSNPVDITAPVSLPWIWGLKYMANLHYNGNSNSVIMRNVGQSLGLGAIILDKDLTSTVNVHNLNKLEHLVHQIKVPEWKEVFKESKDSAIKINPDLLPRGNQIYSSNCMHCHESNKFVGPSQVLREYQMFPLSSKDGKCRDYKSNQEYDCSPNTDPFAALNPIKPIRDPILKHLIPFEESIYKGVGGIKAKYYKDHQVSQEQQKEMEFYNIRGYEFFRDTYNGFSKQGEFYNNYGDMEPGMGYKARHLSGVWATGPFLHNGSVPTLWELLKPSVQRPKYFNVKSMNFDPKFIGAPEKDWNRNNKKCELKNKIDKEICFDTGLSGNSNVGHEWGTELSDSDKLALIEFLKYLPSEPEYSWDHSKNTY